MFSRAVIVAAIVAAAATGVVKRGTFAGHAWSIEVPLDYLNELSATPNDRTKIVGFTPDPRADGTRPLIQLSFMDLSDSSRSLPPLETFAAAMIRGVERRREQWAVEKTKILVGGRTMTRYAWSGVAIPAS